MMAHSLFLIVTGGSMTPNTQEPSQGAGQTRPVNSGKLFVLWRRCSASFQRPRKMRSFHSGIRLFTGQPLAIPETMWPVWQKGVPQSMQREPCARCCFSSEWVLNSRQFLTRSNGAVSGSVTRSTSMNPVGFPMLI